MDKGSSQLHHDSDSHKHWRGILDFIFIYHDKVINLAHRIIGMLKAQTTFSTAACTYTEMYVFVHHYLVIL